MTVGLRERGELLLSNNCTSESVKVSVPLAPLFAVICNIKTLPVPVGPGRAPPPKLTPPKTARLISLPKALLCGNLPFVLSTLGEALGKICSVRLFCAAKVL
jgi:hypothetical protein